MFERLKRNPEASVSPEVKNAELFAQADRYAQLLLDATGRDEAITTSVQPSLTVLG